MCRRENCDVALREQQPVAKGAGMSRTSQTIAVSISPSSKSSMSFSAEPLARLDVKSGDELRDLRDRIEDERHRDGGGEADLQRRNLLALELLGSATRRLCRRQCALKHRKDFLPNVRELRQHASRQPSWPPRSCESCCTPLVSAA